MKKRLAEKFKYLENRKERALIGFITAGDPSTKDTLLFVDALVGGGVDILELGLPFSDPIADGPTIQRANQRSLGAGMNTDRYFSSALVFAPHPMDCDGLIGNSLTTHILPLLRNTVVRFRSSSSPAQTCQSAGLRLYLFRTSLRISSEDLEAILDRKKEKRKIKEKGMGSRLFDLRQLLQGFLD
ncbi:tryptophan synthase subunit alpha [Candidatus Altiarchaeota archaeon]